MTVQLSPPPVFRSWDNLGFPLVGGKLFTYQAGTTIPQATYVDSTQTTQNTNPVVLNFRGEASVWIDPTLAYKFVLQDIFGNLIWTADNIAGPFASAGNLIPTVTNTFTLGTPSRTWANVYLGPNAAPVLDSVTGNIGYYARTAAEISAAVTPTNYSFPPGNAFRYGVDPTGVADSTIPIQSWINAAWAMYQYQDGQGLWGGTGGAVPVLQLPPGKFRLTNTIYLPSGCTFRGTGHPAHTVNHTRLIMDSTGVFPSITWSGSQTWYLGDVIQVGNGFWFFCMVAGAGGASAPSWNTTVGSTTVDGAASWQNMGALGTGASDNRNKPMIKFRRGTLPAGGSLQNPGCGSSIQELEFWFVQLNCSFSNPLSGTLSASGNQRSYPGGAVIAFDVDMTDTRIIDSVFQNSACSLWTQNVSTTPAIRGDGFTGNRGINIFVENCEFDASGAHLWATGSFLQIYFKHCQFFNSPQYVYSCTGKVVYQSCYFQSGEILDYGVGIATGGQSPAANSMTSLSILSSDIESPTNYYFLQTNGVNLVNVTGNSCFTPATMGGIYIRHAIGGMISDNAFDSQGANVSAGSGFTTYHACIKLDGCQNVHVSGNSITSSFAATYNGFGILANTQDGTASQNNYINENSTTVAYNGAAFNGQARSINMTTNDIRGVNYDSRLGIATPMGGSLSLTGSIIVQGATPAGAAGQLALGTTNAAGATTGSSGATPAQVVGYLSASLNGSVIKIPFYNP